MPEFVITAERQDGHTAKFKYNNAISSLTWADGPPVVPVSAKEYRNAPTVSVQNPGGKGGVRTLKVSLGLSCNFACEYCSQRFVPHATETNAGDIDGFVAQLAGALKEAPERVEFWGGEPLVYWKTLRPLAERLRAMYPGAEFGIITNGSLLDAEKNEWLDALGFTVGMSHDGPGQHVRGPDPLDDPAVKGAVLDLYRRLKPSNRFSFNAMMNRQNVSRAAVQEFFVSLTGDKGVPIGEGGFVDPYDEGGLANSLRADEAHLYRRQAFHELRTGQAGNFINVRERVLNFIETLRTARPAAAVGQKCGMDKPSNLAVDMRGNVLTCQNVSAASVAPNLRKHAIGKLDALDDVKLDTATHWSHRAECPSCPMLQICQGACMFLEGPLWDAACDNAFSDAVPVFAAALEFLTGYVPVKIEGPHRAERHAIWEAAPQGRAVIPIVSV